MTSPVRTVLDLATIEPTEPVLCVLCDLLHRGVVTMPDLRKRYAGTLERGPNSLHTDLLLRLADGRLESVGEARFWYFSWLHSLPRPIPQFEVYDDAGRLVARLDFALPEHGIWIEFDGRVKYEKFLRPGESASDAVLREKRREDLVAELTGWRCLRVTWADLGSPARLAARIRSLIDSVAAARRRANRPSTHLESHP